MYISSNPNNEMSQSILKMPDLVQIPDELRESPREFQELMMMYTCAIREVKTKLEVLNDELTVKNRRNPIEMIKFRVKNPFSIVEKLKRRNLPVDLNSISNNLDDVAGIRVICPFLDGIYEVAQMLKRQDDVRVIAEKDYIKKPKDNGYRSYHMILEVITPYPDCEGNESGRYYIEIQLRTIAMDSWASLEHQMKYKKNISNHERITKELKRCADELASCDLNMQTIRNLIEENNEDITG